MTPNRCESVGHGCLHSVWGLSHENGLFVRTEIGRHLIVDLISWEKRVTLDLKSGST